MTLRILHFSDPHVQLRDWRTAGLGTLGPLRKLATAELWKGRGRRFDEAEERLRAIARLAATYDHAVCTGDLTQLGTREEMQLAREALAPLAGDTRRFTTLAGNHDRFPLGGKPVHFFEEIFPEQLATDLPEFARLRICLLGDKGQGAALIVIDSAVPYSWPILSRGKLEPADLAQLESALAHPEVKSRCPLVLTHHCPVRANGRFDLVRHYLQNAKQFLAICKQSGAQAILAGHVHERYQHPETASQPRLLCAGSATDLEWPGGFALTIDQAKLVSVETLSW